LPAEFWIDLDLRREPIEKRGVEQMHRLEQPFIRPTVVHPSIRGPRIGHRVEG